MLVDEARRLLGVGEAATATETKRAYLRAVKAHPPELDPAGFQRVRAAYEVVSAAGDHERPVSFDVFAPREVDDASELELGRRRAVLLDDAALAAARREAQEAHLTATQEWREIVERLCSGGTDAALRIDALRGAARLRPNLVPAQVALGRATGARAPQRRAAKLAKEALARGEWWWAGLVLQEFGVDSVWDLDDADRAVSRRIPFAIATGALLHAHLGDRYRAIELCEVAGPDPDALSLVCLALITCVARGARAGLPALDAFVLDMARRSGALRRGRGAPVPWIIVVELLMAAPLLGPRALESLAMVASGRASDVDDEPLLELAARAPDLDEIVPALAEAVRVAVENRQPPAVVDGQRVAALRSAQRRAKFNLGLLVLVLLGVMAFAVVDCLR
jgi:hypothetical protein